MRRIVLWLMSTLTVLVLLFGHSTSTSSRLPAGAESSAVAPVSSATGSTSGSTSGSTTTYTGDSAPTRWGPVQVEITVSDGRVTDVSVVEYPHENGKDQQINARALPVLVQETLDAQSADIDMVSGATVTSDGYVESLQSALDQAGL
ncbi:FMN-binding protein [Modestobacter excelsi]|uniref:FMN-binding protein n=1 Tax=Modestobacter excelsi TaxID=2213161 RepID=UPI00110CB6B2|nr:FMN-binding protein [Modestobacter excelsi]